MAIRFSVESRGVTRTYELKRSVVTFGRSATCLVPLDDPSLSRTHCQIEAEEDACWIRDLNSRNGTFVNGQRVDRVALSRGDEIVIGQTTIVFVGQEAAGLTTDIRKTEGWTARLFSKQRAKTRPEESPVSDDPEKERLRRLLALNRRVAGELEPERVLSAILDAAIEFVSAERGFLVTVEDDRLYIPVARDFWRKDIPAPAFEMSRSVALEVVRRGRSVISEDASQDVRFEEMKSVYDLHIRSVLCVPLRVEDRTIGAIYLDNRFTRGTFTDDDSAAIEAFADQAAVSLVNSGIYEKSRELSEQWKERAFASQRRLRDAEAHVAQLERAGGLQHDYRNVIGRSEAMRACLRLVDRVTPTDLPVLLCGESGTGKELLARALHGNGPRAAAPFVAMNCAAVSAGLVEAELFGHARGAFTGSVGERGGLFEAAHEGTLLLDEVGDMELESQKRLLRVLETGEVRRVGETRTRRVDVRVLSATHQDLDQLMAQGKFREDLYYRLKGIRIDVPPLRDRAADIPHLIRHFLPSSAADLEITPAALRALVAYGWPGNVRELRNEVDRLAVLAEGAVTPDLLPEAVVRRSKATPSGPGGLKARVEELERRLIRETLDVHDGNKTRAAADLGLSRVGLRKKMARYGLD